MRPFKVLPSIAAAALLAAGAFACSGGDTPAAPTTPSSSTYSPNGGGGGGSSSSIADVTVSVTDSPFSEAKALLVTFDEVSMHQADPGEWKTVMAGTTRTCDLKQLTDAKTDVLGVGSLPTGKYTQVRLNVKSATIYFDNAATSGPCGSDITVPGKGTPVEIPSGEVKLNHEFTVGSTGTTMILDFDGDQSVRQTGGGNGSGNGNGNANTNTKYMMVPVIRIVSVQ